MNNDTVVASDPQNRDGDQEKQDIQKLCVKGFSDNTWDPIGPNFISASRKMEVALLQVTKGLDPILVVYNGSIIRKFMVTHGVREILTGPSTDNSL